MGDLANSQIANELEFQRFANLRAYFGFMWAHPGKKLLFMGGEFAQSREWNHDASLDWHLLEHAPHRGMQDLVRELNAHYRAEPALHEEDFSDAGFQWIDCTDRDSSVFSWVRWSSRGQWIVSVSNFTPVVRHGFRMGVPEARRYRVLLDTDASRFGGSGVLETGSIPVDDQGAKGSS